jgi:hypothetical protein
MGMMEKFGERQAIKLIKHYTGQDISPKFIATCDADIAPNWRGVVVFDNHSIWLVNRLGARGVAIANIVPKSTNGQYPPDTRGFPHYHFGFDFINGQSSFNIYPITEESGKDLASFLKRFE